MVTADPWRVSLNTGADVVKTEIGCEDTLSVPAGAWRPFTALDNDAQPYGRSGLSDRSPSGRRDAVSRRPEAFLHDRRGSRSLRASWFCRIRRVRCASRTVGSSPRLAWPSRSALTTRGPTVRGVLTGDGVVRYERFSDRPAAAPTRGTPTRTTGATTAMNTPEPGTTSNDNSDEEPVRWAGVDWSWSEHAVCVIDDAGAAVERFTVKHTAPGLSKLVTALHRYRVTGVAIERGDGPVAQAFLDAGLTVFVIVSRQVTALRSRYGTTGNKDDRFDAYLLAVMLRTDRRRLTPLTVDTPATVGLRMLLRARQDLVKARVAAHNQLRAHLQLAHPGVVGLFHQLDGKISLAFLTPLPHAAPRPLALGETPGHLAVSRPLYPTEHPDPGPAVRPPAARTRRAARRTGRRRRADHHAGADRAAAQPARTDHHPRDGHRIRPRRARRPGHLHQPAPIRPRPGRDHARRHR